MPLIDLSSLDGPELRSLLDSARRQGQAAQSYEILREMEARRHRGPRPKTLSPKRRTREPRTISLELGDPLDRKEEEPLLNPTTEDLPPLKLARDEPRRRRTPDPPPVRKSRGWAHWGALIFAFGLGGGVAAGWWAANFANGLAPAPAPMAASPATTPAVQTAALPPAVPPANAETDVSLVPQAATIPAPPPPPQEPAAAATTLTPTPAPVATAPAPAAPAAQPTPTATVAVAAAKPKPEEEAAPAQATQSASADEKACGSAGTPADRAICADPKLRRLQGELQKVYADALEAHQDRALLRQHELAWRDARSSVTDPDELAKLYTARIAKLRAATAEALRLRGTPVSLRGPAAPAQ